MTRNPDDFLTPPGRLPEPDLNVLIALADGPKHAYAMMLEIEALSGSRPGPGTLYGAIARLERHAWIEPLPSSDRRRPYQLTTSGCSVLRAHLDALDVNAMSARPRLVKLAEEEA